jgi:hypothetical protein
MAWAHHMWEGDRDGSPVMERGDEEAENRAGGLGHTVETLSSPTLGT